MKTVEIASPNFATIVFPIVGTTPYCQNKMTASSRKKMRDAMTDGQKSSSKRKREPRDFDRDFEETTRRTADGKYGIPAPAFRQAMVRACDTVGFKMTRAKMSVFIVADGYDQDDGMPLVVFTKGEPKKMEHVVTNANGSADIRARPFWEPGWKASVRVRYDADQFSPEDVTNLLARAGAQVGIGAGRAFSPNSAGMGWGHFEIEATAKKGAK
jgi:hypothetical protein